MARMNIFSEKHVGEYPEDKTGWDVYSLLFGPIPILAHRNDNSYNETQDWHSTFSWRKSNIRRPLSDILQLLRDYGALRHPKTGRGRLLRSRLHAKLGPTVERFTRQVNALNIRRIRDVNPDDNKYPELITAMALAVEEVGHLKSQRTVPMLGSKALHFVLPEFFPVWDTARINKECLSHENMAVLKQQIMEITEELSSDCTKTYAAYIHLMVTELSKLSEAQYLRIEKACIARAVGGRYASWAKQVLDWHYDDMSSIVFEICLLGKHRRHIKLRK